MFWLSVYHSFSHCDCHCHSVLLDRPLCCSKVKVKLLELYSRAEKSGGGGGCNGWGIRPILLNLRRICSVYFFRSLAVYPLCPRDLHFIVPYQEKREEIWLSLISKAPIPTENQKRKQSDNTKTQRKTSITKRLRTDLRRSVGVTADTKLM